MATNIPVAFPKYEWHGDKRKYAFQINPDFVDHVKEMLTPTTSSWPCAGLAGAVPPPSTCLPKRAS